MDKKSKLSKTCTANNIHMPLVIRFVDKADTKVVPTQHLDALLTWLEERKLSILVAGSLRRQPGTDPIGAWWVVQAEGRSEVAAVQRPEKYSVYKTKQ